MTSLRFDERMGGWLSFDERSFNRAVLAGERAQIACRAQLRIHVADVDRFVADPELAATATGWVDCDALGGRLPIERATFNLFARAPDDRHLRMRYRLFLRDPVGHELTLSGFKVIEDDPNHDSWSDTTTLFTRLFAGHLEPGQERADAIVATGILRISLPGLVRLMASMAAGEGSVGARLRARVRFGGLFVDRVRRVYAGRWLRDAQTPWPEGDPDQPLYEGYDPGDWHHLPGRDGLRRRIVAFRADDGHPLTLHQINAYREPTRGPVLLAHGAGMRANAFYDPPVPRTIVDALVGEGYDVWSLNWRGSIDFPPHRWSLDRVARYDHPAAVRTILAETSRDELKAVVHCQGSSSFVMAAVAGLLEQVTHVVSTAVSLHPVVSRGARFKQLTVLPVSGMLSPYLDAQWGIRAPTPFAAATARYARLVRHECDDPVCKMLQFMYGSGPEVVWRHDNLEADTHAWVSREFGYAPFRLLRQVSRSARAGHIVPSERLEDLPASYVAQAPDTDARFTFMTGELNKLFLPKSQRLTYEHFDRFQPGRHSHAVVPGFSHLDLYFGSGAESATYPLILAGLED
ncbi:MAG: alpha/beta fold hydrolase [Solirubrobacterales bacterium]|nr:alpha/beta fold hydrolase [Solirubrobacterales bacterium]